jgi:outer membrane receptor protein involved in Fe transport
MRFPAIGMAYITVMRNFTAIGGYLILIVLLFPHSVLGQREIIISGTVADELKAPMAFSNVAVYKSLDSTLVSGTVTDEVGAFRITVKPGAYYIKVSFISFKDKLIGNILINDQNIELGEIVLVPATEVLDEIVVQGEKSSMELALDKRIFNVGKDLANAGGTAADILTNVPSVSVDPEGNVKLRGSDNVRILIDGKPSGLVSFKGGSGLQSLQGSLIERVEVITNPSARYEAEGMAGVINIVLKKDKKQGFNGSLDAISGYPLNMGGAANLNYRHNRINFFINYSIAYRKQPSQGRLYQERYTDDTTFVLQQSNQSDVTGFNNNIRGGLDFFFSEKSVLTASYLFRRSDVNRITDLNYEDYLFNTSNLVSTSWRRQDENEIEPNSEYSLIYKKSFAEKGHDLTAEAKLLDNWESSNQLFTEHYYQPSGGEDFNRGLVQTSLNDESEKQLLFQLDYIKPLGKEGKFETGVRTSFRNMINDFVVSHQDNSGVLIPIDSLNNIFYYDENIHAAYGILGNKSGRIAYQAGLRAEWTDVKTTLERTDEVNPRKYANLFPSAHVTIDLPKDNGLQVSYSRRVRRPVYNDLSAFMTFSDRRNYFSGNPDLNPEFSDVFEIGHIKYFETGSFTSSLYYRDTKDKIDRIRRVDQNGISVTVPENLLSEIAYGAEFTSAWTPVKWWKVDFNFNFFHADIDGSNIVDTYKASTYSWFARQSSRFTLAKGWDAQWRTNYEAPQKTAQGKRLGVFFTDFAMSKEVFAGKGTLNFTILDIFNSRRARSITDGPNFHTEGNFLARRRQINLTLSYRINQAKPAKAKRLEDES